MAAPGSRASLPSFQEAEALGRPPQLRVLRLQLGEYDVLLFWNIERFARGVRIQENAIYALARLGTVVLGPDGLTIRYRSEVAAFLADGEGR